MRILFVINFIPPDHGGGYLRAYRMAERYQNKGELAGIITHTTSARYFSVFPKTRFSEKITFLPSNRFFLPILSFIYIFRNRNLFDKIYIVSPRWHTLFIVAAARLFRKKIIIGVTLQYVDSPNLASNQSITKKLFHNFKKIQFNISDYIVVNSKAVYEDCLRDGYTTEKVRLIVNPVNTEKFYDITDENKLSEIKFKYSIPVSKKVLLFVGVISHRKGVDLLSEIYNGIKEKIENLCLVICTNSDISTSDYAKKFVIESKSSIESFILLENINEIDELYNIADIFLFPTRNEGLPNVIIEAMACKCKILVNTLPGITDFLLPTEMLIRENNVSEYIEKGINMLESPGDLRPILQSNLRRIQSDFSFEAIDNQFNEL